VPNENLSPDYALKVSLAEFIGRRPVFIDFSTRYSVPLDQYGMIQRGICYQLATGPTAVYPPDLSLWNLYVLRGLGGEMFFRDLDTSKAIMIYANSHMESGETLLSLGKGSEGLAEMRIAESITPDLHTQIYQILLGKGLVNAP
jgi:hypothetical protein